MTAGEIGVASTVAVAAVSVPDDGGFGFEDEAKTTRATISNRNAKPSGNARKSTRKAGRCLRTPFMALLPSSETFMGSVAMHQQMQKNHNITSIQRCNAGNEWP